MDQRSDQPDPTQLDGWLTALHRGVLDAPEWIEPHALTYLGSRDAFGRWVASRARVLTRWTTRFCSRCYTEIAASNHLKRKERVRCEACHDVFQEELSV